MGEGRLSTAELVACCLSLILYASLLSSPVISGLTWLGGREAVISHLSDLSHIPHRCGDVSGLNSVV